MPQVNPFIPGYQGSLFGGGALPNYAGQQGAAGAAGLPPQAPQGPGPTDPNAAAVGAAGGAGGLTPQQQAMYALAMTQGNKYQIPPGMLEHMAQSSQIGEERGDLDRQQKLADALRSDAGNQLKGVQAGKRYVGPGAANMVASLMGGIYGASQLGDIADQRKKLIERGQQSVRDVGTSLSPGGGGGGMEEGTWGS